MQGPIRREAALLASAPYSCFLIHVGQVFRKGMLNSCAVQWWPMSFCTLPPPPPIHGCTEGLELVALSIFCGNAVLKRTASLASGDMAEVCCLSPKSLLISGHLPLMIDAACLRGQSSGL